MKKNQTRSYQHVQAISATKIGQVVILLDHCVRLLERAITAIQENKIEERFHHLDQAGVILNTIHNNIDVASSQYARGLSKFFQRMVLGLMEVNLTNDPALCAKIQACLHEMAKIWRKADVAPVAAAITTEGTSVSLSPQSGIPQESLQLSI